MDVGTVARELRRIENDLESLLDAHIARMQHEVTVTQPELLPNPLVGGCESEQLRLGPGG